MTVAGLGLDLIDLAHFAIHYGDEDLELLERCFTAQEIVAAGDGTDRLARPQGVSRSRKPHSRRSAAVRISRTSI